MDKIKGGAHTKTFLFRKIFYQKCPEDPSFGHWPYIPSAESHKHGGVGHTSSQEMEELEPMGVNLPEASPATSQEGGMAAPSNSPIGKRQGGPTFPPCCGILSQALFSTQ